MKIKIAAMFAAVLVAALPGGAWAQQVIQDNFIGASSSFNWKTYNGACLTAGDGSGTIPSCRGLNYYGGQTLVGGYTGTLPDPVGNGALRFTNGYTSGKPSGDFNYGFNQSGGVISNFTFPSGQGLQVTFTTVTYRGDSGGTGTDGADGISFFLMDGTYAPYDLGAFGGSLGFSCSNTNDDTKVARTDGTLRHYDGLIGGYLGLGIDEFGNFLNEDDNTASGFGLQAGRIGLRGAGSIAWKSLHQLDPTKYPNSLSDSKRAEAVQNTCSSGKLWDYSRSTARVTTTNVADYAPIPNAYKILSSRVKIANESALKRGDGVPITYKLKITQNGLLSFSYSYNSGAYQPVITAQDITAGNGPLPSSFRFGFAGSTGGSTNIHEVTCFQAAPADTAASSAGINEQQTAKVQTGTQVYFAFYNPNNWSGSLTAQDLVIDSSTNLVGINPIANWDASCVLSGVASGQTCQATNAAGPIAAQGSASRAILSWNGSTGIPLQFASLTTAQKTAINQGDASSNADRVNYLRGDRTNEVNAAGVGKFRARASVLADIIDSSPAWVGPPQGPYKATWQDSLIRGGAVPENAGQTYPTYQSTAATRLNLVYTGANDGLLHGFRSGSYSAAKTYVSNSTTPNDGKEMLAYMPAAVLSSIHTTADPTIDYSNTQYGHNYYVDAPPSSGDLFYDGKWHTWLVGGLGAGGSAIYALDVTDPASFAEANASSLVVGEWNPTTLTCANTSSCGASLGNTYGVPQIRRFHNGMWGMVFGNGFGAAGGAAGVYVMTINPTSLVKTFYYLSTRTATAGNGIANTTPADLDGDHIVDYIYAGDIKGNIWRFDVTSSDPTAWAVSTGGPLFTTPGGQPITTKLVVVSTPSTNGAQRILVDFGTGQQVPLTNDSPLSYASGGQSLYGIWDWNMNSWNAKSTAQYATLTGPVTITTAKLKAQTVLSSVAASTGYRAVSNNPITWCTTTCSTGQLGWYLNLPGSSDQGTEQIIYNPVLEVGAFIVNTTIPATNNAFNCTASTATGWTMAISPVTGGAFTQSFFGDTSGNFATVNGQVVSGAALNGTGSSSIVTTGGGDGSTPGTFLVTQTSSGYPVIRKINPLASVTGSRLTWVERR